MTNTKKSLKRRLLSMGVTVALLIGLLPMIMPVNVANAAATNTFTAKFNSADARKFLALEFTNPVCGDPMCTTGLTADDFVYTDGSSSGFGSISSCNHNAGSRIAVCVMNQASAAGDTADTIYAKAGAVWGFDGSIPSGSQETVTLASAGDITGPNAIIYVDAAENLSNKILVRYSEPVVNATGGVVTAANFTYVDVSTANCDVIRSVIPTALKASASGNFAVITLGDAGVICPAFAAGDEADTLQLNNNEVYDIYGNVLADPGGGYAAVGIAVVLADATDGVDENPITAPTITTAYAKANVTSGPMFVEFIAPVTSAAGVAAELAAIETTDIQYGAADPETITHVGGNTAARLTDTTTTLTTIAPVAASIYSIWGVAMAAATTTVDDASYPVPVYVGINQFIDGCEEDESEVGTGKGDTFGNIADGEVAVIKTHVTGEAATVYPQEGWGMYRFLSTAIYAAGVVEDGFAVDLDHNIYDDTNTLQEFTSVQFSIYYEDVDSNIAYTDGDNDIAFYVDDDITSPSDGDEVEWFIDTSLAADLAEKTWTTITIDIDGTPSAGTLAGLGSSPQYWGIKITATPEADTLEANDVILIDNVKFIRESTSKSNEIYVKYAEWVEGGTGDPVEDAAAVASTADIGDMTTTAQIKGLGAFETGTLTTKTLTNTKSKEGSTLYNGSIYTIALANQSGGLITQATPVTLSATFTPIATVADKDTNTIETGSTVEATVGSALDITASTTAPTQFELSSGMSGTLKATWTPAGSQSGFSHYAVLYDTTASINVTDSTWGEVQDATLATTTTTETSITSLTDNTTYYAKLVPVDIKGNAGTASSELDYVVGTSSAENDFIGPAAPTGFAASVDEDGHITLTWTDPTDSDLVSVSVLRAKGTSPMDATPYASILEGVKTYTDTDVQVGETVRYMLRGVDTSGNSGTLTSELSILVEEGATAEVEEDEAAEGEGEAAEGEEEAAVEGEEEAAEGEGEGEAAEGEGEEEVVFEDIEGNWAETEIEAMTEVNVMYGKGDGTTFDPNSGLNRAEAAAMLYRVLGLGEPEAPEASLFTDVAVDAWYAGYVMGLKDLDLVDGKTATTFAPGEGMNRAEFLQMAMNVYYYLTDTELVATEVTDVFTDVSASSWYALVVTEAYEKGFVGGKTSTTFAPGDQISRAEAAKILYNMFYDMLVALLAA